MADTPDNDQKTEAPSGRKLEQARERGQVATSKDLATWLVLFAGAIASAMIIPHAARQGMDTLAPFIASAHDTPPDSAGVMVAVRRAFFGVGWFFAAIFFGFAVVGSAAHLLQHGVIWSFEPLKPTLDKISPMAGFKRLFSRKTLVEFFKSFLKVCLVGFVGYLVLKPMLHTLPALVEASPMEILAAIQKGVSNLFVGMLSALFVIAAADFGYQKFEFHQQMRMTKEEVKEEYKQTEGDPHIKGKIKQLRAERAGKRMLAEVPTSTVVITNPTHYAVALRYEHGTAQVPLVTAKGVDHLALKIREIAKEHNVPIVENPPLARALFANAKVDEDISFEHYQAVADVIGYVLRLNKKPR
jgi:flagellar biosynthesis protein FlhB